MRYYALDELVDPVDGQTLAVTLEDRVSRPGPAVEQCRRWCGYLGAEASRATPHDCAACAQLWVVSGWLVSGDRRYPIRGEIPRLRPEDSSPEAVIGSDDRATRETLGYEWRHFSDELPRCEAEATNYFRLVPTSRFDGTTILDAGWSMRRWAFFLREVELRDEERGRFLSFVSRDCPAEDRAQWSEENAARFSLEENIPTLLKAYGLVSAAAA